MILSKQQAFSESQALTASAASTNILDLGAPGTVLGAPAALARDIGKSAIPILVQLDAAAGGTSPTITVTVQTDDNAAFSSATTVFTTQAKAGGAAGDRIELYLLPELVKERYVRLFYTLAGTSPTYTVTAVIVLADQTNDTVPGA